MRLRLSSLVERIRVSLFFVPMVGVLISIVGAVVTIWIDSRLDLQGADLPLGATSTVASARAVLSTVAGATMAFAAIAFSISLLIIQQASSQFSPRVVHTLFRDPFNKRVMGLVMGTFTYCLVVLRSVRSPGESGGDVVIPNLSVAMAVVFGVVTIISIAAFLNHSAHSMDVSQILGRVENEATGHACREWKIAESDKPATEPVAAPDHPAHIVRFDRAGWVQQIDTGALLACLPEETTAWVLTYPGRYAIPGIPLCALSAVPDDIEATEQAILDTISTGGQRMRRRGLDLAGGPLLLPVVASSADGASHAPEHEEDGSDDGQDNADAVQDRDVGECANDDEDYSEGEHGVPIRAWFGVYVFGHQLAVSTYPAYFGDYGATGVAAVPQPVKGCSDGCVKGCEPHPSLALRRQILVSAW